MEKLQEGRIQFSVFPEKHWGANQGQTSSLRTGFCERNRWGTCSTRFFLKPFLPVVAGYLFILNLRWEKGSFITRSFQECTRAAPVCFLKQTRLGMVHLGLEKRFMECQSPSLTTVSITAELQIRVVQEKKWIYEHAMLWDSWFCLFVFRSVVIGEPSETRGMVLLCPFLNCLKSTHYNLAGEFS